MCGITAIIGENPDRQTLDAMLEVAKRRGPEGQSAISLDNMLLGHTQLAFEDIGNNTQPYIDDDGTVITYNGEIYDHKIISLQHDLGARNDTQTMARGIKRFGPEYFLNQINDLGQFAFVMRYQDNQGEKRTLIARDKWGISPLCFGTNQKGQIIIASTPETVIAGGVKPLDVKTLPAGTYGYISEKEIEIKNYHELPKIPIEQQIYVNPKEILNQAIWHVEKRIPSQTQILYTAMGGIDSQFVTATVAKTTLGNFGGAITIVPWNPNNPNDLTGGDYQEASATIEMLKKEGITIKHHIAQLTPDYIDSALNRILAVLGPDYFNICCGLAEDLVAATAKSLGGKAIMTAGGPDEAGRSYKPWTLQHRNNLEEGFYAVCDQFASSEGVRAGLVFGEHGIENRVPLSFLIELSQYMRPEQKQQILHFGNGIDPFRIKMKDKIAWRQALSGYLPEKSLSKPKETIHGSTGSKTALYHLTQTDQAYQKERNSFIQKAKKAGNWERAVYASFDSLDPRNKITEGQLYCLWRWSKIRPESFEAGCRKYFGLKEGEQFRYTSDIEQKSRRPICYDWEYVR